MRTVRALALIPIAALCLAACVDAKQPTRAQGSIPNGPLNSGDRPALVTDAPSTTASDGTDTTLSSGPTQIDVKVGTDSSPSRVEKVRVRTSITINITNLDAADDYEVKSIGLEQKVAKGTTATFNFTITAAGRYEVESRKTSQVLLVIEAS